MHHVRMATLRGDSFELRVAKDFSGAEIIRGEEVVGILSRFYECAMSDVWNPKHLVRMLRQSDDEIVFGWDYRIPQGSGVRSHQPNEGDYCLLELSVSGDEIRYRFEYESSSDSYSYFDFCPVLQTFGQLEQGLLAGVEYLGHGERSSSKADIETSEHLRFMPDLLDMTMPLMAYSTDHGSLAMTWDDMDLQPIFVSPLINKADRHEMSLSRMWRFPPKPSVTIRVGPAFNEPGGRIEDAILWAVKRHGLPPLPELGRTAEEQRELSLAGMQGPIFDPDRGYRHAFIPVPGQEDRFPARWSADHLTRCLASLWCDTRRCARLAVVELGRCAS